MNCCLIMVRSSWCCSVLMVLLRLHSAAPYPWGTEQRRGEPDQRFFHTGGRFSAKALGPSTASSLENTSDESADSMR